ncbi:hypothetical protein [Actinoplanes sp. TFC3]|uniref:hypothetical protein n=1 Tax=Actinoplanes sp. TFC3 TaxID=1710355 RepID=UPI00082F544B|nr:hypothetical protein [Actinoplanes sp. TFC3]
MFWWTWRVRELGPVRCGMTLAEAEGLLGPGGQSGIITLPAGVRAMFAVPGSGDDVPDRDRHYLLSVYASALKHR